MKKITGIPFSIYPRNKLYECIEKIIPFTSGYFTSWRSHGVFGIHGEQYILNNAIYVFPNGKISINTVGVIHIKTTHRVDSVFYETRLVVNESSPLYNTIVIEVNDKFAGYYLLDINTLVLTDWTHNEYGVRTFHDIWKQLIVDLKIKRCVIEEKITVPDISVGCDPEFEMLYNGYVIDASKEIDDECVDSPIGTDGMGDQIEIRPKPGTPIEVTQNIRKLLKKFYDDFSVFELGDAGNRYPLGGHIHVGLGTAYNPTHDLIEMFDDFIGRPTIELSGKARGSYMRLGQFRIQPHGFEYRSTPAAVFHNAAIANIVMKLAKNLTKKFISGKTLLYNDVPTEIDYIEIGGLTRQQARYFMTFCRGGFKPSNELRKSWKICGTNDKKSSNHIYVIFQNSWSLTVKNTLRSYLNSIEVKRPITVVLYGLGSDTYGHDACTLRVGNSRVVEARPKWNRKQKTNILYVGVSLDRRHIEMPYDHRFDATFRSQLVSAIAKEVQEA